MIKTNRLTNNSKIMKNNKLPLSELKVKSFVTDLEDGKSDTVKGGSTAGCVALAIKLITPHL